MRIVIDGRTVAVEPGWTVLQACRAHGVALPTLCHLEGLSAVSSCRVCLVHVTGLPRALPACSCVVRDGMVVETDTESLRRHRRAVVELLLSGGDHVCAFCPASGRCALQDVARQVGLDHTDVRPRPRAYVLDASRPRFVLDPGRCILCTRCVRTCAEVEGARSLLVAGRGARTHVATDGGARWADSPSCTDCGRCVAACPTGALLDKATAAQGLGESRGAFAPASPPAAAPDVAQPAGVPRLRLATAWLDGCSGCHMSLLDLDERLLALAPRLDLVWSPLADASGYPGDVDACLVEGAVGTEHDRVLLARIRERTRTIVALGDCAVRGNVSALRDAAGGIPAVLARRGGTELDPELPPLLERVRPLHEVVPVDVFVPGCPPPAERIHRVLSDLVAGRTPAVAGEARFG